MGWGDFALEDGYGHGEDSDAEALDASSDDECCEVGHEDLDEGCDEVDEGSYSDGHSPAQDVADVGAEEGGDEGCDV